MNLLGRAWRTDPVTSRFHPLPHDETVWWLVGATAVIALLCLATALTARAVWRRRAAALARTHAELRSELAERARSEENLRAEVRALERSSLHLQQFASAVSHDLRSPLRGIATLAEWISADHADALGHEGRTHLALLRERTLHLHRMIDGILEYSLAVGGIGPRSRVDSGAVVRAVVAALDPQPGIEVVVVEPLPACHCNATQLCQVFQNLIGNALRHLGRPRGVVTVTGRVEGDAVVFRVSDDGVGIPADRQEHIFRIFHSSQPEAGGDAKGVGLAIVQRIVESNGGELGLDSKPGEGSTFRFSMPGAP